MPIIIWRGLEELNFHDKFNRLGFCHWTKSPKDDTLYTKWKESNLLRLRPLGVWWLFAPPGTSFQSVSLLLWVMPSLVSFLGLSGVLSFATFRVVHACPSEVTSPLTRNLGFGERIRTSMGSYPVYPRIASPLRYHTRHHCTLLIRLICLC